MVSFSDSFQWWKHIYPGDDPIDTTKIQGRSLKVSKLKQDWDKAHADFKDYIKNFQPTLIDESDQQVYEELNRKQPSDDSLDFIIDEIERESRKSDAATNKKESSRPGSVFDPNIEGETPEERAEILKKKHDWYHNNTIEDVMAYNGGRWQKAMDYNGGCASKITYMLSLTSTIPSSQQMTTIL